MKQCETNSDSKITSKSKSFFLSFSRANLTLKISENFGDNNRCVCVPSCFLLNRASRLMPVPSVDGALQLK